MSYSKYYLQRGIKIPNVIGIFVVFLTAFIMGRYLFTTVTPTTQGAKQNAKNIKVTNVSPSQATIFWQTDEPTSGWIIYGNQPNSISQIALDERDIGGTKKEFLNHFVTLKNLNDSTPYYYKLVVNNQVITASGNKPFEFKTLAKDVQVSDLRPAYGKVFSLGNQPLANAVVLLHSEGRYSLSSLSKQSGEWLIPLNYLVDAKQGSLKELTKDDVIRIEVFTETGDKSTAQTNINNVSPIPDVIVVGKDYDFTQGQQVLSAAKTASREYKIEILFPKRSAVIPSSKPLIKGTALPAKYVDVVVSGNGIQSSAKVQTDAKGAWNVSLDKALPPGRYTLQTSTVDSKNNQVQKTQFFSIGKSGEQVLAEATSSATTTPTSTPSATPSPTSTLTTNITPTTPVTGTPLATFVFPSIILIIVGIGLLLAF